MSERTELTFADALAAVAEHGGSLADYARQRESELTDRSAAELDRVMLGRLEVMRQAVSEGLEKPVVSRSGLAGGDGHRLAGAVREGRVILEDLARALAGALAVAEVNAAMGRIVAAPTAGSCGVIPGVLLTVADKLGAGTPEVVQALWVAGLTGEIIQYQISLSGAQGGCQAECGAAAAMAAAGACHLAGGGATACADAAAIALTNLLGLVCDPVAGQVEVPCIKRNAGAAAVALAATEMALAGVRSRIPPDEVALAMRDVGRLMPACLRETGEGGLADTPTGRRIAEELRAGAAADSRSEP